MKILEVEVGRFVCRQVRDYLNRMKFDGYNIEFFESSGLISRDFAVRGDEKAIAHFESALMDFNQRRERIAAQNAKPVAE